VAYLRGDEVKSFQLASLVVRLLHRGDLNQLEYELVKDIFGRHPKIARYARTVAKPGWQLPEPTCEVEIEPFLAHVLGHTSRERELGVRHVRELVERFSADRICVDFMATWLMLVCCRGLSPRDTLALTLAMRDSGNVYDYRSAA
jgi:hypothetical protein